MSSVNPNDPVYVYSQLQSQFQNLQVNNDNFFMFYINCFIFIMQFGFGLFEAGVGRTSFSIKRTLVRTFLCTLLVMIVYWRFGYSLAFGGNSQFGGGLVYWAYSSFTNSMQLTHFWLQYGYAVTCCSITLGALSERSRMVTYLVYCFLWGGFVYPILSHWAWTLVGFLYLGQSINYSNVSSTAVSSLALQYLYNQYASNPATNANAAQYIDISGSGIVHVSGGVAALIGALFVRPRTHRFDALQSMSFRPHSSTLMSIGAAIILFGMLFFNCGGLQTISLVSAGTSAMTMVNTVLSAGSAMLFVFVTTHFRVGSYDLFATIKGGIAGTVAASCSAGVIAPWGSVIVGLIAGMSFMLWSALLLRWKVDDVTDAFAVHAGAGMWGLIALAFLHPQFGILFGVSSGGYFLVWQLAGIGCVWAWSGVCATVIFGILRLFRIIRLPVEVELKGTAIYQQKIVSTVESPEGVQVPPTPTPRTVNVAVEA